MAVRVESLPRQEQIQRKPNLLVLEGGFAQNTSLPPKETLRDNSKFGTENPEQLGRYIFTYLVDREIDSLGRKTRFNVQLARERAVNIFHEFVESNEFLSQHLDPGLRLQIIYPKV